jgi:urease accessory protein
MAYSRTTSCLRTVLMAMALSTPAAFAHNGDGHAHSLAAGLMHPMLGLDHLLAMVAIGIWAAQYSQPVRWVLPLLFPMIMALGAFAGMTAGHLPGVEPGIAGSVAVLGLLIAFAVKLPIWASSAVVSLFALAHGFAHGVELPIDASPALYGAGFIFTTLALHAAGLLIGMEATRHAAKKRMRLLGAAIAAAGTYFFFGIA